MRSFIPNLAEITSPLRELLKINVQWTWGKVHSKCVEDIKNKLINAPTLVTFDINKVYIQTDSSKSGVGCCIFQDNKPIAYASRSLNEHECHWAQIKKEMCAILYACERFHEYVYGKRVPNCIY